MVSGKSQGLGVEMVFSEKTLTGGWRKENSSEYGKEILRHPSLCFFGDFLTGLGEIIVVKV